MTKCTDSDYWRDNCESSSIPDSLQELISLWRYHSPWIYDEVLCEEMFPSASYQYILYGMGFETREGSFNKVTESDMKKAEALFAENAKNTQKISKALQSNRELIEKIKKHGLHKI